MKVDNICVECRVSDILAFFKQESPLSGGKGPLTPERKKEIEDRLSKEANKFRGMWCIPGDYPSEGVPRSNPEMKPHRKAVKAIVKTLISKDSKLGWDDGYGAIYAPRTTWQKALDQYEKSQKKFHDSLGSIKEQLFDAPEDVKQSFNSIVKYFTYKSHGIDDFMIWKSVSLTDKNTGTSITLYSNPDMGFMYVQHEPTKEQGNVLNLMHLKWHKEKVQVGMSETGKPEIKEYFIIDGNPSIFNTKLKSHSVGRLEIHAVPDYKCLEYLKNEGFNVSSVKQFDDKLPEKLSLSGIYHEWKGPMGLERQSASELSGYFKGIQDDTYKEYKDKSKNAIYSRFKTAVEFFKKSEGSQTGALADTLVDLVKAYNEK